MKEIHQKLTSILQKIFVFLIACGALYLCVLFLPIPSPDKEWKFDFITYCIIPGLSVWLAYAYDKTLLLWIAEIGESKNALIRWISYLLMGFYSLILLVTCILAALTAYYLLLPAYIVYWTGFILGKGISAAREKRLPD